jgi:hypothetical protein
MENIEKILLAIIAFAITSVLAYLFKMRQLYVALPKLYSHAPLTKNGALAELIVYNRGNQVEEEIQIEIDQALSIDLIASSSAEITLEKSIIKLNRLHKGSEQSVVLLIEEGSLNKDKIKSISSKGVKGRLYGGTHEVPPNFARFFLFIVLMLAVFPALFYGLRSIDTLKEKWAERQLSALFKEGWNGLQNYYGSDLRESYHGTEFPLRLINTSVGKNSVTATYEVANKTALPLEVSSLKLSRLREDANSRSPYYGAVKVTPLTAKNLNIEIPFTEGTNNSYILEFFIENGEEKIIGVKHAFKVTQTSLESKK